MQIIRGAFLREELLQHPQTIDKVRGVSHGFEVIDKTGLLEKNDYIEKIGSQDCQWAFSVGKEQMKYQFVILEFAGGKYES